MEHISVRPGDVVVTNFTGYQHWSIVTERFCSAGKPMLISATKRTGTVKEEPWDDVVQGSKTYVADITQRYLVDEILSNARSEIDQWEYSLASKNCEHFVKWASGLDVGSSQIKAVAGGAVAGAAIATVLSKKPNAVKFLSGMLLLAGIALVSVRAKKKEGEVIPVDA